MRVLQNFIFPNINFHASEEMYARAHNEHVFFSYSEKKIMLQPGALVSFDTFFNGLTIHQWKKHCHLDDLFLGIVGVGRVVVRIGVHRIGYESYWIEEKEIELSDSPAIISVLDWPELDIGILYVSIHAVTNASLFESFWATNTEPRHDIKMGIVITHFNRKKQVIPAIKRIASELLYDVRFKGKVELLVIDNSQNVEYSELGLINCNGVRILPNKNLGGSGGFTRGLLELKRMHGFTHCLFMDDDASCEIESIKRTFQILAFGRLDRLAVAGSLLRELEPYRLFEKGALFDGLCHPLKGGLDMRAINDLLFAELIDRTPDYGGWWFFAFPIHEVREYAFPFFVRGDDIRFGLSNRFPICTMNGIGCWGEDFAVKSGPLPLYLDTRNHLIYAIASNNKVRAKEICNHFVMRQLYSYNYASARACRMAMQHVMKGPEFFAANMDMSLIRGEIGQFAVAEKLQPVDRQRWHIVYGNPHERRSRRWFRKFLLNGFLLPSIFLHKKHFTLFQHKAFQGNLNEIYRYQQVLYECEPGHLGYLAVHDKKAFFKELYIFQKTLFKLMTNFETLRDKYVDGIPKMTSQDFWNGVYQEEFTQDKNS